MTAQSFTYSGNVYTGATAGTVDFALTSTGGNPILYLEKAHIHVYKSTNQGSTWTELTRPSQWDFVSSGTVARLVTGISAGEWVKVQRITPSLSSYVTFQASSLLTAEQLNSDTLFNTYLNQERFDQGSQSDAIATAASTAAASATSTANTALSNSTAAQATAASAVSTANAANATSSSALSVANTKGDAAIATANAASASATNAVSTANAASTSATNAVSTANAATASAAGAVTTANNADVKADAAIAAVASSVNYTGVANVASIPASPSNNTYIEVANSTGLESFTPLAGMPVGFVGDSGLRVRLRYTTTGTTWNWIDYFPTDADGRYVAKTSISSSTSSTSTTTVASSSAVKVAKDVADSAQSAANAASSAASAAQSSATAAQSSATQAVSDAAAAQSTANAALPKAGGTMTGNITFNGGQTFPGAVTSVSGSAPISVTAGTTPTVSVSAASTSASGVVQLSDSTSTNDSTKAATSAAVKSVQDFAQVVSTTANAAMPKAGGTFTGIASFESTNSGIATASGSQSNLEAKGTGGAAFISFHRPNAYAGYFGLDTDNQFKVGGWSFGAAAYPILHSNNYNTYAPTKTGTGASGTWGINITGSAGSVAASGITGQTGMWTSTARPGPYRLYRNDSNDAYNIQTTWSPDRSGYWSLRGYLNDTYHAPCFVAYSGYADSAATAGTCNAQVAIGGGGASPAGNNVEGTYVSSGNLNICRNNEAAVRIGRTNDGAMVAWFSGGTQEGVVSVNGATITYASFLGSHWGRLIDNGRPEILAGTILETVDKLIDWKLAVFTIDDEQQRMAYNGEAAIGDTVEVEYEGVIYTAIIVNEVEDPLDLNKHTCVKVNDTPGSTAVFGVFVNWDNEQASEGIIGGWNDLNCGAVGNYFIRIAPDQDPQIGDLIEADGNGCGVVQADDIIRARTVGKITSTIRQRVYDDGSFLLTAVLYCG